MLKGNWQTFWYTLLSCSYPSIATSLIPHCIPPHPQDDSY